MVPLHSTPAHATEAPVRVVSGKYIALTEPHLSANVMLTAIMLEDTGWTEEIISSVLTAAMRVLAQCDVSARGFTLIQLATDPQHQDLWTPASRRLAHQVRTQVLARESSPSVLIFFVRDTRNTPEFAAEAFGLGNTRTRPELTHSIWITRTAPDLNTTIAHEMFHVLANSGDHTRDASNLMSESTAHGGHRLTPHQCDSLHKEARKNNLLHSQ